ATRRATAPSIEFARAREESEGRREGPLSIDLHARLAELRVEDANFRPAALVLFDELHVARMSLVGVMVGHRIENDVQTDVKIAIVYLGGERFPKQADAEIAPPRMPRQKMLARFRELLASGRRAVLQAEKHMMSDLRLLGGL